MEPAEFLSKKIFAVAGSFKDETKYAYQIYKKLKKIGKKVYPVNPGTSTVDGEKCYASVKEIKDAIEVVNLVTPPSVSLKIARECKEKGINYIWAQPGASDKKLEDFCKENNINLLHNICVLIETGK